MSLLTSEWPTARKPHRCMLCSRVIDPGEKYNRQGCVHDGRAYTFKSCAHCLALIDIYPDTIEYADEGYTEEDLHEWEPRTIPAARLRAQYRRRWRNLAGDLYPIPTVQQYPPYPRTHLARFLTARSRAPRSAPPAGSHSRGTHRPAPTAERSTVTDPSPVADHDAVTLTPNEAGAIESGRWYGSPVGHVEAARRVLAARLAARDAVPATAQGTGVAEVNRAWAERFLAAWVKPYFGDDALDAVAAVRRAALAAAGQPTTQPAPENAQGPDDCWMVTQTILASPALNAAGVYGNCIQAAVASALGLHLDAVPHFGAFRDWQTALHLWAKGEGLVVERLDYPDEMPPDEERCLYLGPSPRGYQHVVVGQNREVVWDPHPSRGGLAEVTDVIRVYKPCPPGRLSDATTQTAPEATTVTEWGIRHNQGTATCSSEADAQDRLPSFIARYESNSRNTVEPYIVRRTLTDWVPVVSEEASRG